jgi:hypothetical protein
MSSFPTSPSCPLVRRVCAVLISLGALCISSNLQAQNTPLISGGVGFFTTTNGGNTNYAPAIAPLLTAPLGQHFLIESRATAIETFFPQGGGQGYGHRHFVGPAFAQADYIANPHVTAVGGYFLTPFGTYNERLTPIWISNLQDSPLIFGIGTMGSGSGLGGMLRGSAISKQNYSINYAAYLSAGSTNTRFPSSRSTGGQASVYFPNARLEVGTSYGRLLETTQVNAIGTHVWWEPASIPLKIRSEYAHGPHSQGYWVEADYRLSQVHGETSLVGRLEPVFRIQQTFRNSPDSSDGLPAADTQRVDFGLNYHLPHEVRINTSYARRFSSTGDLNTWETAVIYRFLFPAWRGK